MGEWDHGNRRMGSWEWEIGFMGMGEWNHAILQELGDALMEVKRAIEDVRKSKTLKQVLGTLLSIGNFLNGTEVCPLPTLHHPPLLTTSPTLSY